jgi:HAD superfamily hydrolase (TIGR01509 family)
VSVKAVIFDCDGTLVDSERLARRAWTTVLGGYGIALTDEDYVAVTGKGYPQIHEHFGRNGGLPAPDALWPIFADELFVLLDTELEVFADAVGIVRALHDEGVPMAVASSSARARLDRTLRAAGIAELFDATVAGDEVARPKPMPDSFLVAAKRLGAAPSDCVVIEDSPTGVAAGLAAGMRTVAVVRDEAGRELLADAHHVVDLLEYQLLMES